MHVRRFRQRCTAIVLQVVLVVAGAEGVSATQGLPPPACGGRATAPAGAGVASQATEEQPHQSSPVLRRVADVPLPGGTARFDYQSLDDASGRLYVAHMGAGQVVVFDTGTRQVLTVIDGLPQVTGVWVVPELDRLYASTTGVHQVAIIDTRSSNR
jgi:streptogramin lyase